MWLAKGLEYLFGTSQLFTASDAIQSHVLTCLDKSLFFDSDFDRDLNSDSFQQLLNEHGKSIGLGDMRTYARNYVKTHDPVAAPVGLAIHGFFYLAGLNEADLTDAQRRKEAFQNLDYLKTFLGESSRAAGYFALIESLIENPIARQVPIRPSLALLSGASDLAPHILHSDSRLRADSRSAEVLSLASMLFDPHIEVGAVLKLRQLSREVRDYLESGGSPFALSPHLWRHALSEPIIVKNGITLGHEPVSIIEFRNGSHALAESWARWYADDHPGRHIAIAGGTDFAVVDKSHHLPGQLVPCAPEFRKSISAFISVESYTARVMFIAPAN